MAEIRFPNTKDGVIVLGKALLAQAPKAGKTQGVRVPSKLLSEIRKNVRAAEKDLALARRLRRDAEQATARADRATAAVEKAARRSAQVLKELVADSKDLGAFGFQVDEARRSSGVPQPT